MFITLFKLMQLFLVILAIITPRTLVLVLILVIIYMISYKGLIPHNLNVVIIKETKNLIFLGVSGPKVQCQIYGRIGHPRNKCFQLCDLISYKNSNGQPTTMLAHGSNEFTSGWFINSGATHYFIRISLSQCLTMDLKMWMQVMVLLLIFKDMHFLSPQILTLILPYFCKISCTHFPFHITLCLFTRYVLIIM